MKPYSSLTEPGLPHSVLGDPVFLNIDVRKRSASAFIKTARNLGYNEDVLLKFYRWIVNGICSSREAFAILEDKLSLDKAFKYELFCIWIAEGFCKEQDFYFPEKWHGLVNPVKPESTTLFG